MSIKDLISSESSTSSTRWTMIVVTISVIIMSFLSIIGFFVLVYLDKDINTDLFTGISLLLSPLLGIAIGGKSVQVINEKKAKTVIDTTDNNVGGK